MWNPLFLKISDNSFTKCDIAALSAHKDGYVKVVSLG